MKKITRFSHDSTRRLLQALLLALVAATLVSRAGESIIYEKNSLNGDIFVTEDEHGMRTLMFERNGARQTVANPNDPDHLELRYTRSALVGLALCDEPRRMLVVGLGGGTLPIFLHRHYTNSVVDAAEISRDVVEVARKFFGFRDDARLRAHVGDGRRYIEEAMPASYDVIFLDAFGKTSTPPLLTTQEFLQSVRRALTPQGVAVANIWSSTYNPLYDSMVRTYQEVFDELFILEVPEGGNRILLALPRKQPLTRTELARLARNVSTSKKFRYDLGELVEKGFSHPTEKNPNGHVLLDRDVLTKSAAEPQK